MISFNACERYPAYLRTLGFLASSEHVLTRTPLARYTGDMVAMQSGAKPC